MTFHHHGVRVYAHDGPTFLTAAKALLRLLLFFTGLLILAPVAHSKILVIGDSHTCGEFGKNLAFTLSQQQPTVVYCAVSSSASNWVHGTTPHNQTCYRMESPNFIKKPCQGSGQIPKLASIMKQEQPAKTVIALGTNSLGSATANSDNTTIAALTGKTDCTWIGPPYLNPAQAKGFVPSSLAQMNGNLKTYYPSLKQKIAANCRLIDSRPVTAPGTAGYETVDGVHRGKVAGKIWAQGLHFESPAPKTDAPRFAPLAPYKLDGRQ